MSKKLENTKGPKNLSTDPASPTKERHTKQQTNSNKKKKKTHLSHEEETPDKYPDEKGGHSEADDLDEDDEEEDDSYYDNDEEDDGFIVPDAEVEEEERAALEQLEAGEPRKKKKRHRHHHHQALDEDDRDLIEENIGVKVDQKKRKRLTKQSEKEMAAQQKLTPLKSEQGVDQDEKLFEQNKKAQRANGYSNDEEEVDTRPRQRQRIGNYEAGEADDIDPERVQTANAVFGDPSQQRDELYKKKTAKAPADDDQKMDIDAIFQVGEIDDIFGAKVNKEIQDKDIPERIQVKIPQDRMNPTEDELIEETNWVFQVLKETKNTMKTSEATKKKIHIILKYIRVELYDIPFIAKYRKFDYFPDLDEDDIWLIANLDIEFGTYKAKKLNYQEFFKKIGELGAEITSIEATLKICETMKELNDFQQLVTFYKQYYQDELVSNKKAPMRKDAIYGAKTSNLQEFAKQCLISTNQFLSNLESGSNMFKPQSLTQRPGELAQSYISSTYNEDIKVIQAVCSFVASELAAQPYIRRLVKQKFYQHAYLFTEPTELGKKELDVFHPSYRVKSIHKPLFDSKSNIALDINFQDDMFLDIVQMEEKGFIQCRVILDTRVDKGEDKIDENKGKFYDELYKTLQAAYLLEGPDDYKWNVVRTEIVRRMLNNLVAVIPKEIKEELREISEAIVVKQCQQKFEEYLMTGPFILQDISERPYNEDGMRNKDLKELIPDRPRLNVMSVILTKGEGSMVSIVSVGIVDKYGEMKDFKEFTNLLMKKQFSRDRDNNRDGPRQQRGNNEEETKEYQEDKRKICKMIQKYKVDLITVGANHLEARRVFEIFSDIAEHAANDKEDYKSDDDDSHRDNRKEARVIYGTMEIAKLFTGTHHCNRLHKDSSNLFKQCASLARYQQDPMNEVLNLWSYQSCENQCLNLNLHYLQNKVPQPKLHDALEEVAVRCVNNICVDLNLLTDHESMHTLLTFIAGLGPRKARSIIQRMKQTGNKLNIRGELYKESYMSKLCYMSCSGFIKIRHLIDPSHPGSQNVHEDLLDQTRIHPESYMLAKKVSSDALDDNDTTDQYERHKSVSKIIQNPALLQDLDLKRYAEELDNTGKPNMKVLLDFVAEELQHPMKDPRKYREFVESEDRAKGGITKRDLFYQLIGETPYTFKKGMIMPAIVSRISQREDDNKVICRLDCGLTAFVRVSDIKDSDKKIEEIIQVGSVILGRIEEIKKDNYDKFSVNLTCKRDHLEKHNAYVDPEILARLGDNHDDLRNSNFQIEKQQNNSRYQKRKINHPQFQNISFSQVMTILKEKPIGDFIFRPSSKGEMNLTCSWKFTQDCYVHLDIAESGPHKKADNQLRFTIGSLLAIGSEKFDNLQEIVERYILVCNKYVRDTLAHPKYLPCTNLSDLQKALDVEKNQEPAKIPYKFTILPEYPQHIVLGYMMKKNEMTREFIKVKPRGYWFHERYENNLPSLIMWFKQNQQEGEYRKHLKRAKSPRVKMGAPEPRAPEPIKEDWGQENNNRYNSSAQTPFNNMKSEYNTGRQSNYNDGGYTAGGNDGGQFSSYQNEERKSTFGRGGRPGGGDDGGDRGRGGSRGPATCYNCQETGHMSRECTNPKRERGGGRGGRGRGGDRNNYNNQDSTDNQTSFGGSRPNNDQNQERFADSSYQEPPSWGGAPKQEDVQMNNATEAPGWGDKPASNFNSGPVAAQQNDDWGNNQMPAAQESNTTDNWGGGDNQNNIQSSSNNNFGGSNSPRNTSYGRGGDDGGRGRGRGGRGRGGNACFNCNQEGHMSRDCPDKSNNSGGGGRGRGPMTCYKCQKEGHMAKDCTEEASAGGGRGRGRGPMTCYNCQKEGHGARECTEERNPDSGRGRGRGRGAMKCYNCQGEGHSSRDCTEPRNGGGGGDRGNRDNYGDRPNNNFDGGAQWQSASGGGGTDAAWGQAATNNNDNAGDGGDGWGGSAQNTSSAPMQIDTSNNNNNGGGGGDWGNTQQQPSNDQQSSNW